MIARMTLEFPQRDAEESSGTWIEGSGTAVFVPRDYEPGHAYPVVVWLEDSRGSGFEARTWFPLATDRNVIVIALQPPLCSPLADRTGAWRIEPNAVWEAIDYVERSVAEVADLLSTNQDHLFLAGRGDGAAMATDILCIESDRYAGAIAVDPVGLGAEGTLGDQRAQTGKSVLLVSTETVDLAWRGRLQRNGATVKTPPVRPRRELASEINRWIMSHVATVVGLE